MIGFVCTMDLNSFFKSIFLKKQYTLLNSFIKSLCFFKFRILIEGYLRTNSTAGFFNPLPRSSGIELELGPSHNRVFGKIRWKNKSQWLSVEPFFWSISDIFYPTVSITCLQLVIESQSKYNAQTTPSADGIFSFCVSENILNKILQDVKLSEIYNWSTLVFQ
jgi:hypothetical protein